MVNAETNRETENAHDVGQLGIWENGYTVNKLREKRCRERDWLRKKAVLIGNREFRRRTLVPSPGRGVARICWGPLREQTGLHWGAFEHFSDFP